MPHPTGVLPARGPLPNGHAAPAARAARSLLLPGPPAAGAAAAAAAAPLAASALAAGPGRPAEKVKYDHNNSRHVVMCTVSFGAAEHVHLKRAFPTKSDTTSVS